jgi:hypothetical protein
MEAQFVARAQPPLTSVSPARQLSVGNSRQYIASRISFSAPVSHV